MKPEDFLDSKSIDQLYGDQNTADYDAADGIVFACALGVLAWLVGYCAFTQVFG